MRLVPFTVAVPDEERHRGLKKKIQQKELPGVFTGCWRIAWHGKNRVA
jgi:phage/plasmid-associated DNA primase